MRFYISYTNRRGTTHGAGIKTGYGAHIRGWNSGVKVVCNDRNGNDVFTIYATGGSSDASTVKEIGVVSRRTPDGPVFIPAKESS